MKVVFITHGKDIFPQIRGKYLLSQGHSVFFIGVPPLVPEGELFEKRIQYIEIPHQGYFPFYFNPQVGMKVRKITREIKPDIVHILGTYLGYLSFFVYSKKIVIENNGSDILLTPKKYPMVKYYYFTIFQRSDGVVQDSEISQKASYQCGARKRKNRIIPLGIDSSIFNNSVEKGFFRKKYNITENTGIIVSPRSLKPLYNIKTIIKALAKLSVTRKDFKGVFAGYSPENQIELEQLVGHLELTDNVLFIGQVPQRDLAFAYSDSSVVISVPTSDSLPSSVLEAMACKAPVIISDIEWYKSLFKQGVDLETVPVNDSDKLAEVILNTLEQKNPLDYSAISNKVLEAFSIENCGKRLEKFYYCLLGNLPD
ncbi:MAG: glycosyltransferase family 4 protein [Candidatus Riflebacteria bacterium]|nr:glycosyltransferase family 4 protein [Candidatus Riflebacteria bacterium]